MQWKTAQLSDEWRQHKVAHSRESSPVRARICGPTLTSLPMVQQASSRYFPSVVDRAVLEATLRSQSPNAIVDLETADLRAAAPSPTRLSQMQSEPIHPNHVTASVQGPAADGKVDIQQSTSPLRPISHLDSGSPCGTLAVPEHQLACTPYTIDHLQAIAGIVAGAAFAAVCAPQAQRPSTAICCTATQCGLLAMNPSLDADGQKAAASNLALPGPASTTSTTLPMPFQPRTKAYNASAYISPRQPLQSSVDIQGEICRPSTSKPVASTAPHCAWALPTFEQRLMRQTPPCPQPFLTTKNSSWFGGPTPWARFPGGSRQGGPSTWPFAWPWVYLSHSPVLSVAPPNLARSHDPQHDISTPVACNTVTSAADYSAQYGVQWTSKQPAAERKHDLGEHVGRMTTEKVGSPEAANRHGASLQVGPRH